MGRYGKGNPSDERMNTKRTYEQEDSCTCSRVGWHSNNPGHTQRKENRMQITQLRHYGIE